MTKGFLVFATSLTLTGRTLTPKNFYTIMWLVYGILPNSEGDEVRTVSVNDAATTRKSYMVVVLCAACWRRKERMGN